MNEPWSNRHVYTRNDKRRNWLTAISFKPTIHDFRLNTLDKINLNPNEEISNIKSAESFPYQASIRQKDHVWPFRDERLYEGVLIHPWSRIDLVLNCPRMSSFIHVYDKYDMKKAGERKDE